MAETMVSIKRIQSYMLYEETDIVDESANNLKGNYDGSNESTVVKGDGKVLDEKFEVENEAEAEKEPLISNGHATLSEAGICINHVHAKWDTKSTEYTLEDVNLRVQPGTLVAIIGPVGAGKSRQVNYEYFFFFFL